VQATLQTRYNPKVAEMSLSSPATTPNEPLKHRYKPDSPATIPEVLKLAQIQSLNEIHRHHIRKFSRCAELGSTTHSVFVAATSSLQYPLKICCISRSAVSRLLYGNSSRHLLAIVLSPLSNVCVSSLPCLLRRAGMPPKTPSPHAQAKLCLATALRPMARLSFIKPPHFLVAWLAAVSFHFRPPGSAGTCRRGLVALFAYTALIWPPQPGNRAFAAVLVV